MQQYTDIITKVFTTLYVGSNSKTAKKFAKWINKMYKDGYVLIQPYAVSSDDDNDIVIIATVGKPVDLESTPV